MTPDGADELDRAQRQLLVFARELNDLIAKERSRRDEAQAALQALQDSYLEMIRTLAFVVEAKDTYTRAHLDRTYQYACALTRRMAPDLLEDPTLHYGFLLHDIGKVGIPERILLKPGPLTDEEWAIMRTHPIIGAQVVKPMRFLGEAVHVIRSHHERWDGKGYPQGLAGGDIHLAARIFSVVDTFDAMTSDRPYRKGLPVAVALEEIAAHGGTQFDPEATRAFVALVDGLDLDDLAGRHPLESAV